MMNYFRAIIKSEELTERAFELAGFVINSSCGNYNAWLIRKKCIVKFDLNVLDELEFVKTNMVDNEKVYQIWL